MSRTLRVHIAELVVRGGAAGSLTVDPAALRRAVRRALRTAGTAASDPAHEAALVRQLLASLAGTQTSGAAPAGRPTRASGRGAPPGTGRR